MQLKHFNLLAVLLLFYACEKATVENTNTSWLIPQNEIRDGGPGKDGIPSIDNPTFINVNEVDFLSDNDLVVGVKVEDEIRVYPHIILDWHEIVNDQLNDLALCLNYCPLTGTAIGWNRTIDGQVTTFGVSGLLYNTNLIPYDRLTNSNWSQMRLDCVEGELRGKTAELYPVVETTWENWKNSYPNSKILSLNTGFNRQYGRYPYGDYRTSDQLIFPVSNTDNRLPAKERVLGVIVENEVKVYRFESVSERANNVIQDQVKDNDIVVFGSQQDNYLVAYEAQAEGGETLNFTALEETGEAIAVDDEGNKWNVFGEAISGDRKGQRLLPTKSYIGYFFSWAAFYPSLEVYE